MTKEPSSALPSARPLGPVVRPVTDTTTLKEKLFSMPNSPATDAIMSVLMAGSDLESIPLYKKDVNRNQKIKVLGAGTKRRLELSSKTEEILIELPDINKLVGSNKTAKQLFLFSLKRVNDQAIHNKQLTQASISFSLRELVDIGMYKTVATARKGFVTSMELLSTIKVKGKSIKKKNETITTSEKMRIPFIGYDIEKGQCIVYLNTAMNWGALVQYYTVMPSFYFKLSNKAGDLLWYIFYLARQHVKEIAEKGHFNISFRAIHAKLLLPRETKNPERDIKNVIERAIEEIETHNSFSFGEACFDFALLPVYQEADSIKTYLDTGYLKVSLSGDFAKTFVSICNETTRQIEAKKVHEEKIIDAARTKTMADKIKTEEEKAAK